ncbi:MAG: leucine-rich repeat domain-containing protein, partial [Clostridia bacterium]|nr:leucine-rich repeat domain-containing protein [Clostridia bacterium]
MKKITRKTVSVLLALLLIFSAAAFGITASASGFLTINNGEVTYCNKNAVGAIEIPSTVTKIRSSAFSGCNAITEVTVPSSVTSIGSNAFDGCTALKKVVIEGSNCKISSKAFNSCSSLEEITLPSKLSAIEDGTFADCISLKSISIPSTVTLIGAEAFSMCQSLTEMVIPASVKTIRAVVVKNNEKRAANPFVGCTGITSFTVESGNSVYSSDKGVLYGPLESP